MSRLACALTVLLLLCAGAARADIAVEPTPLPPAQEARAQKVMHGLRCLVCQNESIADSNAELARDLRQVVRERVAAGDSNDQVRAYMVQRYGDWVLLDPPFKASTALLWLSPLIVFLAGGGALLLYRRGRRAGVPEGAPLDADERQLLAAALAESDDGGPPPAGAPDSGR
jgi:cytochrome c-type biogenesis protein CcmH